MQEVIITQKIKVDNCIAQEIVWLNSVGISTLNCCCGHGTEKPSAIIKPSSHKTAKKLNYKTYYDENIGYSGGWVIELFSECKCNE